METYMRARLLAIVIIAMLAPSLRAAVVTTVGGKELTGEVVSISKKGVLTLVRVGDRRNTPLCL